MRLKISHKTTYDYDEPVTYALQQLRLTPKSRGAQTVLDWTTTVTGGSKELSFEDAHRNTVDLISSNPGTTQIEVLCEGEVEVHDNAGITGPHAGFMPLWMFERVTRSTKPGPLARKFVGALPDDDNPLNRLHALSQAIHDAVPYETGASEVDWTTEDVLTNKVGVCQDHAHVFITCARLMGHPARYVSGYLMMDDRIEQEATHAWAEAWLPDLGWVGFDISNAISPDTRYVRIATGLDYFDAAPVSGMRFGQSSERMSVVIQVQQQ
ncbi:transglutaminase family protein [Flavimaricola marinus]|nr:transglutaminase family protein [Flavimaricola marinus]